MTSVLTSLKSLLPSSISSSDPQWTLLPTSSPTSPSHNTNNPEKRPSGNNNNSNINSNIWLTLLTFPFTFSLTLTNFYSNNIKGNYKLPAITRIRSIFLQLLVGCVVITCVTMVFALSGMTGYTVKKLGVHFDSDAVWKGFPVMTSYYNGIYDLVPKELNIAENTGPNNAPKASTVYRRFIYRRGSESDDSQTDGPPKEPINSDTTTTTTTTTTISPPKESTDSNLPKQSENKTPKPAPKKASTPIPYHPYPDYTASSPHFKSCESLVSNYTGQSTRIKAYKGVMKGMPDPAYGSYEALGLDDSVCFERRMRFGGYGWKDRDEIPKNPKDEDILFDREWRIDWKQVQDECVKMNSGRFDENDNNTLLDGEKGEKKKKKKRTAVVLRVWNSYPFTRFDYVVLRSLITELNVNTGGEYGVHLLMHVKDIDMDADKVDVRNEKIKRKILEESIAEEFWGITTLWSENLMKEEYKELQGGKEWREHGIYDAYRSIWLPQQWFSKMHEEYEYFWSLEMDVKYTGHWYHLFDKIDTFARNQPRRGLWARNARFYVPSVHGSYQDFTEMVEMRSSPEERIWGAVEGVEVMDKKLKVEKKFEREEDDEGYKWGKGENADLVTLSPMFEVVNTTWVIKDDFTGYGNERPEKENYNPYWTGPPRRGAVVAVYRFSRRLLNAMEVENRGGRHMGVEMFPASVALQYGYKGVYAPHPVFMDRRWPGRYLEKILNGGEKGSSGGNERSLFGKREHHFGGSGFYYGSYWPRGVMGVWMGGEWEGKGGEGWERERGRGCLGGMVVHPVKDL
ncbi:hypothetical protein AOL_s00173g107 [Orbilia oligospora ATCC 24927]|uniref:Uncharacterized protein n=1 Tax=Arthrobotrys oligospora (strain ATCC 24927 / CBS 115.81 / DSM 1491) TaxID=756982 RepID=G1XNT9_ARTOA|nr:hypothetical protein AOL_s00173g107 [Orbilia oligospora ATCC 24927]EGX45006.1 hypothetical protein AOL_s00173g107 [Orbilia oligospora ATCC 24927]